MDCAPLNCRTSPDPPLGEDARDGFTFLGHGPPSRGRGQDGCPFVLRIENREPENDCHRILGRHNFRSALPTQEKMILDMLAGSN